MSHGDYTFYTKRWFTDKAANVNILAATDYTTATAVVSVKSVNHQLFVQRITVSPTTYAAKKWTFQDSAGTPIPAGQMSIPASAPTTGGFNDQYILDYGPEGYPLTVGKNLNMIMDATGAAASLHIEAYEKVGNATTNFNQQIDINGKISDPKTTPANA